MPEEKNRKEPIKVTDRRSFTMDGQRRTSEGAPSPEPERATDEPVKGEGFELRHGPRQQAGRPLPSVDFSSFIVSLASTAFMQLGEVPDPATGATQINLEGARQMIEILDMLRVKTEGNLEAQETEFLTGVVYELKLKFAEKASRR